MRTANPMPSAPTGSSAPVVFEGNADYVHDLLVRPLSSWAASPVGSEGYQEKGTGLCGMEEQVVELETRSPSLGLAKTVITLPGKGRATEFVVNETFKKSARCLKSTCTPP